MDSPELSTKLTTSNKTSVRSRMFFISTAPRKSASAASFFVENLQAVKMTTKTLYRNVWPRTKNLQFLLLTFMSVLEKSRKSTQTVMNLRRITIQEKQCFPKSLVSSDQRHLARQPLAMPSVRGLTWNWSISTLSALRINWMEKTTRQLRQLLSSRCLKSSLHASFLKTSLKQNSKLSSLSRTALHQTLCSLLSVQKTFAKRGWLDLIKMIQITKLRLFFQRGLEFTMITGSSLCLSSNHRLTWRLLIPNRSSRLPLKSSVVTLSQLLST